MTNLRKKHQKSKAGILDTVILDTYEQKIVNSIERGEWTSIGEASVNEQAWMDAARRYKILGQSKQITFRVNQGDLVKLKAKAANTSIPYQTLLSALIRDFVEGDYVVKL